MTIKTTLFAVLLLLAGALPAQQNFWSDADLRNLDQTLAQERLFKVTNFRAQQLNTTAMKAALRNAPLEGAAETPLQLAFPMPNGGYKTFEVVETQVMAPGLAARYPGIKTYKGWNPEDRRETLRFGHSHKGFYATILDKEGAVYIDGLSAENPDAYMSYYVKDNPNPGLRNGFICEKDPNEDDEPGVYEGDVITPRSGNSGQVTLRTYRAAIAVTGEYTMFHGGSVADGLAAVVQKVNRLNQVFVRDLAVRLQLVEDNDQLIFTDPDEDDMSNGNTGNLLAEVSGIINPIIGFDNYDVGHVLNVHGDFVGNGVANLQSVCTINKARGVSGITLPQGDPFVIDIIAHEFGHQFGATHTMNSCQNVEPSTAFEPGSGSTIMGYAGICGSANNVQDFTNDNFHTISLQQIYQFTREGSGDGCPEKTPLDNTNPEVSIPLQNGFYIPTSTPFELTANATDAEDTDLTYCWEQFNLGPNNVGLGNPQENSPLFRSLKPTASPTRVFPRLSVLTSINPNSDPAAILPAYERNMTFRCTVRDNNETGGGVSWEAVSFEVDGNAGPFRVQVPNELNTEWKVGDYQEVRWDVANTDNSRVNCQTVNILLSIDGGFTYPFVLAENVPNDGSHFITVPDALSDDARIRVEAADNIFFDISDRDFDIVPATEPGYTFGITPENLQLLCLPTEPVEVEINTQSILGFDSTLTLSILGVLPGDVEASLESDQLMPGESTTLTLDVPQFGFDRDTFALQLQAIAENGDTSLRDLRVIVQNNNFSDMQLVSPVDGVSDIVFTTDFMWEGSESANSYDIEIATEPTFTEDVLVESATALVDTLYEPDALFDAGETYFWRVRPVNECGPADFLTPSVFKGASVDCEESPAGDTPITLPASSVERRSTIFVEQEGTISDINVKEMEIIYSPINALQVSLISPSGTEVLLFDQSCLNTTLLRASFDDDAPDDINCPPITFAPVTPEEPLAAFEGESTFGEGELVVNIASSGSGGSISKWSLEFCAAITPVSPVLLVNEVLEVRPGGSNPITADLLSAEKENTPAQFVEYMITEMPEHGQLFRGGIELQVGDEFTQQTINALNLLYVHDGGDATTDQFAFVINDDEGGLVPTEIFNINILEDAIVNTRVISLEERLKVYPNPAQNVLNIHFGETVPGEVALRLVNLQGQMLRQQELQNPGGNWQLDLSNLPTGLYLLQLQSEEGLVSRKIVIQQP